MKLPADDRRLVEAAPQMYELLRDAWDAFWGDPNERAQQVVIAGIEELLCELEGAE